MIETIEYKNFQGFTGDSHKVGVSKPLSELTADDIINYDKYLCGEINKYVNVTYFGQIPQISLPEDADNKPMFSTNNSWDNTFWCSQPPKKDLYMRTLLLNVPNNKKDREYTFTVLDTNVRIVTELTDFQDMYITTKIGKNGGGNPYANKTEAGTVETGKISGIVKNMLTDTSYITPVWVITDGTNLWITSGVIYHKYYVNSGNNLTSQGFFTGIADFNNNKSNSLSFGINPNATVEPVKCTDLIPNDGTPYTVDMNGKKFGIMVSYTGSNYQPRGTFWFNNNIESNTTPFGENNQFIDITAYYGMYMRSIVKNNGEYVWYKPIITGGMVTGYTTDMNAKSDIDEWEILENHNIPIIPPSSGTGDDIDEIGINDFPFNYVGGLARYYAIDRFQLDELISDFKKSENGIPLDAGQFVIGLYQLPVDIPSFCTTSQEKIVLGKLETNAVGKKLLTVNRKTHLGEYFISSNCGNNFLDYAPYTEIKLYVPFCGIVELPPNLFINSTVSVDMIIDIISGSCKGVVMCNNTFYTSINGSLMCSLPLSLEQCATKSLSVINSANSIMSGIIFGNKNYSALNTVTTLGEAMIENNNIAPSHISGNMDSVVNFYDPQCCILFMTYPDVNMGDIGKTHGKVCNYQDTLKNCHGYTVVNNPHLEIKCTNTEKDEITKLLEQGVILP